MDYKVELKKKLMSKKLFFLCPNYYLGSNMKMEKNSPNYYCISYYPFTIIGLKIIKRETNLYMFIYCVIE